MPLDREIRVAYRAAMARRASTTEAAGACLDLVQASLPDIDPARARRMIAVALATDTDSRFPAAV